MNELFVNTFSGGRVDLLDPQPEQIEPVDIAHHLGMLCRFNGAARRFYSVAEHSLLVSALVPDEWKLHALLHDAAEAYIGDLVSPMKWGMQAVGQVTSEVLDLSEDVSLLLYGKRLAESFGGRVYDLAKTSHFNFYAATEHKLWLAIAARFGIDPVMPDCIKQADLRALATEKKALMPRAEPWACLEGVAAVEPAELEGLDVVNHPAHETLNKLLTGLPSRTVQPCQARYLRKLWELAPEKATASSWAAATELGAYLIRLRARR